MTPAYEEKALDPIYPQVAALVDEIVMLRRDFHRHPELGLQEVRTGRIAADYLEALGMEVRRCNVTGVVGVLRGTGKGPASGSDDSVCPVLMLRADMDALPVQESADNPCRSEVDGVMHACGHDAHTAILLVAAKILAGMRDELPGDIVFVFQPNEEEVGALAMIAEGALDDPRPDACMGLHVWNQLPLGVLGVRSGPIMAGMYHFTLTLKGKGGHTATPHEAVDPVLAASAVIQGVQAIQTREVSALSEPMVVMFGSIHGGTVGNVIPDSVTLEGTIRYLASGEDGGPESPRGRFERVVAGVCTQCRTTYDLEFSCGHPTLVNDPGLVEMVREQAAKGMAEPLLVQDMVTLAGEDFSEFAARIPGVFYFLGAGKPGQVNHPHHHPCFDIDERVLAQGVEMHVRGALAFFAEAGKA